MLALLNINVTQQQPLNEDLKVLHHLKLFCDNQESNPVIVVARQSVISFGQALRVRPSAVLTFSWLCAFPLGFSH